MKNLYPIRKAVAADISPVLSLLESCALPAADIPRGNQVFWVVETGGAIAGVAGLEN